MQLSTILDEPRILLFTNPRSPKSIPHVDEFYLTIIHINVFCIFAQCIELAKFLFCFPCTDMYLKNSLIIRIVS